MANSGFHILVVGAGSVGKRHLRNLGALGCTLSAVDPRADRLAEAAAETPLVGSYPTMTEALRDRQRFAGAVVASPPSFHVTQCIDLARAGLSILLEKPLSPALPEALELERRLAGFPGVRCLLGYTYRWWPPLEEFRRRILAGEIGTLRRAQFVMSAHLADWHPWERYQDFFMAQRELGGGALLDESHFLDLLHWLFDMPERVFAKVEHLSDLEIDTDDNVDVLALYGNGFRAMIHLDLYGRPHEKYIVVTGDKGTLRWSFDPNQISVSSTAEQEWAHTVYEFSRNDMFVRVAEEFLSVLAGEKEPSCTVGDGVDVLRIVEACRQSSAAEKVMAVARAD